MQNESGIAPVEFKVLVKPDTVKKKTAGGILLPDDPREREGWAQVMGTLVAKGESAFSDWSLAEKMRLKPGARVYFSKYQGILMTGADGDDYRLCNDKDIGAIIEDEAALPTGLTGRVKGALSAA